MPEDGNGGKIIAVKNWHVVLTVLLWMAYAIGSWATQRADLNDLTRRVGQLEDQRVSKSEFEMAIQDLKDRLADIRERLNKR